MKKIIFILTITYYSLFAENEQKDLDCNKYLILADEALNKSLTYHDVSRSAAGSYSLEATALIQRYEICLKYPVIIGKSKSNGIDLLKLNKEYTK